MCTDKWMFYFGVYISKVRLDANSLNESPRRESPVGFDALRDLGNLSNLSHFD